ncbi:Unknown protein [Striga hermonthica]|uniref:Uncharacterized protein n=1 Tax=Striga hermonthica TaxID=68872 RepID=A0A9N7N850_STRHE|nr:Unknown protein [Striga hermonthica]
MASVCISSCVDDARAPVRATYTNLYKWPESDFEFIRSMSSRAREPARSEPHAPRVYGHPRVVDSISCRQLDDFTFITRVDGRAISLPPLFGGGGRGVGLPVHRWVKTLYRGLMDLHSAPVLQ